MRARLRRWLAPLDPSSDLRRSLKLRSANTGTWYLQSKRYRDLKHSDTAVPWTWLYGSAGCGKTILSAGIIEDLVQHCREDSGRALAFFFFDFNDAAKQDTDNMLRSILSQLLEKCQSVPGTLHSAIELSANDTQPPSTEQLLSSLMTVVEVLPTTFIVIDALDECSAREDLFAALERLSNGGSRSLRVILTSRRETDIEDALESLVPYSTRTCLETSLVDKDIQTFVHERLTQDKSFRRWQKDVELQAEIEAAIESRAGGMYE